MGGSFVLWPPISKGGFGQRMEPLHPAARELPPPSGGLASYPPIERWADWQEYDPVAWPRKVPRRYSLIPTICFNCEAACGPVSYTHLTLPTN